MEKTRQDPSISTKPFPFKDLPAIIWLFSESDIPTFVLPNSAFGLLGALAGPALADGRIFPSAIDLVFYRLPLVILFNWAVVFIFQLANQRSPEAIQEDRLNKPWRPLPTGRISAEQTRRLLLVAIPAVLALTYGLRVWQESALIMILAWMYNDLKGGDELSRDLVIAIAYGLFNASSLRIALGSSADLNPAAAHISRRGYLWITMISGVILTTMSIQDLKDMAGDRSRGRLTIPLLKYREISVHHPFFSLVNLFPCAIDLFVRYREREQRRGLSEDTHSPLLGPTTFRLVIRNTGHDYLKSKGPGALAMWTHHLKEIEILDYNSTGSVGPAIRVGARVQVLEAMTAAHE
ncbi:hypothetical protein APSETT444_000780 [Aspergillus pseudonomiae]